MTLTVRNVAPLFIVRILGASTSGAGEVFRPPTAMIHPRTAPALVALIALAASGCGGWSGATPAEDADAAAQTVPSGRYAQRTDLLAITIPEGSPTRWYTAGFPPLRSVRLYPNTPDRDLALDLRKQLGKNILDPTDPTTPTPKVADRIARLVDSHFGTPAVPTVRVPEWDTVVATAVVRTDPDKKPLGATLKAASSQLASFKWDMWPTGRPRPRRKRN